MYNLSEANINELSNLVDKIVNFDGKWIDLKKSNLFFAHINELANNAMEFLYKNELIIVFDWMNWDEGCEFSSNTDQNKYDNLNREFILKLLTAVARNDRFCTGAWGALFETGEAQLLFKKLLETYRQ